MPMFVPPDLIMNIDGVLKAGLTAIWRSAVVASGNAVFNLTVDNTPTGTPLFNNVYVKVFQGIEVDNAFSCGAPTISVDKKTMTVAVKRTGAALTILGLQVIGAPVPANGSTIYAFIVGD